jgi:phosphoribosylaminoimidazole (AIR) synthetase
VGEHLLAPHLSYLAPLKPLLSEPSLHAMAHITAAD